MGDLPTGDWLSFRDLVAAEFDDVCVCVCICTYVNAYMDSRVCIGI